MKLILAILPLLCLSAFAQKTNSIALNWEWKGDASNYDFELFGSTNLVTWFPLCKVNGTNQFSVTMTDPGRMFFTVHALDRQIETRLAKLRKRTPAIIPPIPKP